MSGSVEGLQADHVTVIDSAGRMLSQRTDRALGAGTASQLDYQTTVETELMRRVQGMLDEVLGVSKASVRVSAQVEFSHGERTEERVDPNTVVKSEQRSSESSQGTSARPSGLVGTASNVGAPPGNASGTTSSNETAKEAGIDSIRSGPRCRAPDPGCRRGEAPLGRRPGGSAVQTRRGTGRNGAEDPYPTPQRGTGEDPDHRHACRGIQRRPG